MSEIVREMMQTDLDTVVAIEQQVHSHPWTHGNFADALQAGYLCRVLESDGVLIGYAVLMSGVDDAELLDIGISTAQQRRGFGRMLLEHMLAWARTQAKQRVVLEVRASNLSAIALYQHAGFQQICLRRAYYLTDTGRENAILMGYEL